ncbi:MAG: hypothetical protein HQM10_26445 [Candidatus Riflebacteria bacterium]|nr:hypothetical protein [Candidatus Riflebacteria bacterium]
MRNTIRKNIMVEALMIGLFFVFSSVDCSFAAGAGFGVADYSILAAFHPKMARYDFNSGRFFHANINPWEKSQMDSLNKKVLTKKAEFKPKLDAVERDRNRLLKEMTNFEDSSRKTINLMMKEGKNTAQIQESMKKKRVELDYQLLESQKVVDALVESSLDPIYLSKEKSRLVLSSIFEEIDKVLSEISRERGGVAIIDRSYIFSASLQNIQSTENIRMPPVEGYDVDTACLLENLWKTELAPSSKLLDGPDGHKEKLMTGIETAFRGNFEKCLSVMPAMRNIVSTYRGRMILAGGEDYTALALTRILKSNGIKDDLAAKVVKLASQM